MSVILHLSDTHFGTERPEVQTALLAMAHDLSPDLIILSGDMTQRARLNEFAAAGEFFANLPDALRLVVPGNHDIPLFDLLTRFTRPFAAYARCFGRDLSPSLSLPDVFVVGVNSVRPWRHQRGSLSGQQIDSVARQLRRAGPGRLRVVVVHHPLDVHDAGDTGDIVGQAASAVAAWSAAGADLVLSGHVHVPLCRPLSVRYGTLAGDCWTAGAGTAVSRRTRSGCANSVNVLRIVPLSHGERRCVEQWDFDAVSKVFLPVALHELPTRTPGDLPPKVRQCNGDSVPDNRVRGWPAHPQWPAIARKAR